MPPPPTPLRLVVLISGSGTTLKNLIDKIHAGTLPAKIERVISSNPAAGGLRYAEEAAIATDIVERNHFQSTQEFSQATFDKCRQSRGDLVVMGGFLKKVTIPADFQGRVVNIHPSLIPSFCGQGYYGHHVHEAALKYGVKISGCTVHFVDNEYDHGPIIHQQSVPVEPEDTPESLARRVFAAECDAYPRVIRWIAEGRVHVDGRQVRVDV